MDVITYALCKKMASAAVSGISNIKIDGTKMTITTNDGNSYDMTFPTPSDGADGISIASVDIDENGHLICTMSDGTLVDAGELPIPQETGMTLTVF